MGKESLERIAESLESISRGVSIAVSIEESLVEIRKELGLIRKILEQVHGVSIRDYGIIRTNGRAG